MLISLIIATMLMGGSAVVVGDFATGESLDALRSKIRATVKDPERSRAAQEVLERWREPGKDYFKAAHADHEAISKLTERHDATRAEFNAVNRRTDERDAKVLKEFIATREALSKQLTREEWATVFKRAP